MPLLTELAWNTGGVATTNMALLTELAAAVAVLPSEATPDVPLEMSRNKLSSPFSAGSFLSLAHRVFVVKVSSIGAGSNNAIAQDPARIFIRLILMQAHEHGATELLIGSALAPESTITEKVGGTSYHVSALPSDFHSSVLQEMVRMAAFPAGPFPKEGEVLVRLETTQLRWKVHMRSADSDAVLSPINPH